MPILAESARWIAAFLLAAGGMFAQSRTARPSFDEFEVAAVRPTDPDWRGGRFLKLQSANQLVAKNHTLKTLLANAYSLPTRAILGGPEWIDSERFDITARIPGDVRPTVDEQMRMLRKLLAERFSVVFHREQKVFSIYALVVGKNGPKLKKSESPSDGDPSLVNVIFQNRIHLPARNATMAEFASMMQRAVLDRPVVDHTGLAGKFDFDLEWTPDETQFDGKGPKDILEPVQPGLFAAVQQQLGLKLEATRGPVEILVIDKVARPSAN